MSHENENPTWNKQNNRWGLFSSVAVSRKVPDISIGFPYRLSLNPQADDQLPTISWWSPYFAYWIPCESCFEIHLKPTVRGTWQPRGRRARKLEMQLLHREGSARHRARQMVGNPAGSLVRVHFRGGWRVKTISNYNTVCIIVVRSLNSCFQRGKKKLILYDICWQDLASMPMFPWSGYRIHKLIVGFTMTYGDDEISCQAQQDLIDECQRLWIISKSL